MVIGSAWGGSGGGVAQRVGTPRPPLPTLMATFALFCLLAVSSVVSRLRVPAELGGDAFPPAPEPVRLATRAAGQAPAPAQQHAFPTHLTLELVRAVNKEPSLVAAPGFPLGAFAPAPWLLPPRALHPPSNASSYDLLEVAAARARLVSPRHPRAVAVAFFSAGMLRMLQNAVYSAVKFGGLDNYIIVTWTRADLAVCLDLNLPCADAATFLPNAPGPAPPASDAFVPEFETTAYNRIMWLKPAVVKALLEAGFTVLSTDIDLAYTSKSVWDSYLSFMAPQAGGFQADAAFQAEHMDGKSGSPVNSGNYVALPTPGSLALFEAWMSLAAEKVGQGGNQKGLTVLFEAGALQVCDTAASCAAAAAERNATHPVALIRAYKPPWWEQAPSVCALQDKKDLVVDPCSPALLYLHPICTPRGDRVALKTETLRRAGFWFMDTEREGGCPRGPAALARASPLGLALQEAVWAGEGGVEAEVGPERCLPAELVHPGVEAAVARCADQPRLAFV